MPRCSWEPVVRLRNVVVCLAGALAISACAQSGLNPSNNLNLNTVYLDRFAHPNPTLDDFSECHGFNCTAKSSVSVTPAEWRRVTALFSPPAKSAKAERQQIARAVAEMQKVVGAKSGTAVHQWTHKDMLILPNMGDPTQLDCVDEAVNTWTYMTLMEQNGLFRYHRVAHLSGSHVFDVFTRNTAVMQEIDGGYYAIDPSLVDFGVPPPVLKLKTWLGSWPPDLSKTSETAPSSGPARKPASSSRMLKFAALL
jgi:hypothetical protein